MGFWRWLRMELRQSFRIMSGTAEPPDYIKKLTPRQRAERARQVNRRELFPLLFYLDRDPPKPEKDPAE